MANRWRQVLINEPEHLEALSKVTTISEVMQLYGVKYHTSVQWLIDKGDISAVKVGGTWILSMDSVIAWYGDPPREKILS